MTPEEIDALLNRRRADRKAQIAARPRTALNALARETYAREKESRRTRYEEAKQARRDRYEQAHQRQVEPPWDEEEADDSHRPDAPSPPGMESPPPPSPPLGGPPNAGQAGPPVVEPPPGVAEAERPQQAFRPTPEEDEPVRPAPTPDVAPREPAEGGGLEPVQWPAQALESPAIPRRFAEAQSEVADALRPVGAPIGAGAFPTPASDAFEPGRPVQQTEGGVQYQEYGPSETPEAFRSDQEEFAFDDEDMGAGDGFGGDAAAEELGAISRVCEQNQEALLRVETSIEQLAELVQQHGGVGP